jgi:hypothetical protein
VAVETPKPEILLWAWLAWAVVKEAPDAIWAYFVLYDRIVARQRPRNTTIEPPPAVVKVRALAPAVLTLGPAIGMASTRMELTTPGPAKLNLGPAIGRASTSLDLAAGFGG